MTVATDTPSPRQGGGEREHERIVVEAIEGLRSDLEQIRAAHASERQAGFREGLEAAAKWRPIDTGPNDGTPVLVGWAKMPWHPMVAHEEEGCWGILTKDMDFEPFERQPTHWMPLPNPPGD